MVGYGFARYKYPLKNFWMAVLLLAFLLPPQVTSLPNYLNFSRLKLADGTVKPFLITAILGQGCTTPSTESLKRRMCTWHTKSVRKLGSSIKQY